MKIAVTSASGNLGSAIVKSLIKEIGAANVVAIARTPEKATHLGVEVRKGDYNNREDFDKALKGIDKVMLLSGMDLPENRIVQHQNVIAAANQNGVKKIVYTSIIGDEHGTSFSPIVNSNRQTELDIKDSGMEWVIGRNGIYIEPDLEYIPTYIQEGMIKNSADQGKCAYTSREELSYAYSKMLLEGTHNGQTYNLVGEPITQSQLAEYINQVYDTNLIYVSTSIAAYKEERQAALGDFLGNIVAGIYEGIRNGATNIPSDFFKVASRTHKLPLQMIKDFLDKNN